MATLTRKRTKVKAEFSCRLVGALAEINGRRYHITPIAAEDPDVRRAWRLEKAGDPEAVYDVAETAHGCECSCPDFEVRHRGLPTAGCKHIVAARTLGLLDAPKPTPTAGPEGDRPEPARQDGPPAAREPRHDAPAPSAGETAAPAAAACCGPEESRPCSGCAAESWPAWTDSFTVELPAPTEVLNPAPTRAIATPDAIAPAPRLDLAGLVDAQAAAAEAWGTAAGDLIADHLRVLAAEVRAYGASTPGEVLAWRSWVEAPPALAPSGETWSDEPIGW